MSKLKVVLFGTTDVGKTALFGRMSDNLFDPFIRATLQGDSRIVKVERDGLTLSFVLNDTAGQERFRALTRQYFRGATVGLLVFSIASSQSLTESQTTAQSFQTEFPDIPLILIGNKCDLDVEREVLRETALRVAESLHAKYLETSALTGEGIQDLLATIAEHLIERGRNAQVVKSPVVSIEHTKKPENQGCC
jgi:small GTP-binding protein